MISTTIWITSAWKWRQNLKGHYRWILCNCSWPHSQPVRARKQGRGYPLINKQILIGSRQYSILFVGLREYECFEKHHLFHFIILLFFNIWPILIVVVVVVVVLSEPSNLSKWLQQNWIIVLRSNVASGWTNYRLFLHLVRQAGLHESKWSWILYSFANNPAPVNTLEGWILYSHSDSFPCVF